MTRILVSKDPFETEKSTSIYFTFKADVFADSSLASSLVLSWGWNERKESCSLPVGLFGQNLCRMMLIPLPSLSFLFMYQSPCCSLSLSIPCLLPSLALVSCSGLLVKLPSSSLFFLLLPSSSLLSLKERGLLSLCLAWQTQTINEVLLSTSFPASTPGKDRVSSLWLLLLYSQLLQNKSLLSAVTSLLIVHFSHLGSTQSKDSFSLFLTQRMFVVSLTLFPLVSLSLFSCFIFISCVLCLLFFLCIKGSERESSIDSDIL